MLHNIPFSIPEQFASGLTDGSIVRIGTLLKDAETGKILAHVQESGLGQALSLPFSPFSFDPVGLAQNLQLKQMMEHLALLQYTNIGIAAVGLGVSVIGFIHLHKKIKGLESSIETLSKKMDKHFQDLYEREMRRRFVDIHALFGQLEQLQHFSSLEYKRARSVDIESGLCFSSEFLCGEIAHHWDQDKFDLNWFNTLVSCLLVCDSSRIQCLLMSDEMSAAKHTSAKIAETYCDLFDAMGPVKLSNKILANTDEKSLIDYKKIEWDASKVTEGLSEVTNSSLTKVLLIEHLIDKSISGNQFISEMNANTKHPIILLEA